MIILGLGSNIGDRLNHLRTAIHLLKKIPQLRITKISPVYLSDALLPENAPTTWHKPYLNLALSCETNLSPSELLPRLKQTEQSCGRHPVKEHWGPRVIDIDILAWDELVIDDTKLTIPHLHLEDRPFALWPLADIAPFWQWPRPGVDQGKTAAEMVEKWGSRFTGEAPLRTVQINHRILQPRLVGVLNITPDSFSDGGNFLNTQIAIRQAQALINAGAEIIDIGAEATSPMAQPLDAKIEWLRIKEILPTLLQTEFMIDAKISVDTRHADVAEKVLAEGAHWINDVTGLDDPEMVNLVANSSAHCVVMHHLSIPENRQNFLPRADDTVQTVFDWGKKRLDLLQTQGIPLDRIIFDPGIGFGKMAEQSCALLKNVELFHQLGAKILIGHSRKTFLSLFTAQPFIDRDIETLALSLCLTKPKVDFLRVHNVEMCARGLKIAQAFA